MKYSGVRLLIGVLLALASMGAQAGRIDVAASGGVGVVAVAADGQCSLREAMLLANGAAANGNCVVVADSNATLTIDLPADTTFTLADGPYDARGPNGLPSVTGAYAIAGHGATIIRSTAPGTPRFRILHVAESGSLEVADLGFRNGHTPDGVSGTRSIDGVNGGAIYNAGDLVLTRCVVAGNTAGSGASSSSDEPGLGGDGGGIFGYGGAGGKLVLHGTTVSGNTAGDGGSGINGGGRGGRGGGIHVQNIATGTLTIENSRIRYNQAGDGGADLPGGVEASGGNGGGGGGIYFVGTSARPPTIVNSFIEYNAAGAAGAGTVAEEGDYGGNGGNGGGIAGSANSTAPPLELSGSVIRGNVAGAAGTGPGVEPGSGGGVYCQCSLHLTDSLVSDNSIPAVNVAGDEFEAGGAGIAVLGSHRTLEVVRSTIRDNLSHAGDGGGILADVEEVLIRDSSLVGNLAARFGGGLYLQRGTVATMINATVAGNTALGGRGGGVLVRGSDARVRISYSTISSNTGGGVEIATDAGGDPRVAGLHTDAVASAQVEADHSILGPQASGADCPGSVSIVSGGYNLDSDGSCGLQASLGDIPNADPLLAGLFVFGGTRPLLLPMSGSPALDAIPASACFLGLPSGFDASSDGRGRARPAGTGCDIGAVERWTTELRGLGQDNQHALAGDVFSWPLTVQALDADGDPVVDLMPLVTVPSGGASAVCASEPTDATGVARIMCAANADAGSYTVQISWFGHGLPHLSVNYSLTNLPNDRIFGTGFGGAALPTAASLP